MNSSAAGRQHPHGPPPLLCTHSPTPRFSSPPRFPGGAPPPPRRFPRRTVEPRRVPRLPDDTIAAGGVHRAQDRPDVVRIFDLIKDDDERRPDRTDHQILHAQVNRILDVGDDPLVRAALRETIELMALGAPDRAALL